MKCITMNGISRYASIHPLDWTHFTIVSKFCKFPPKEHPKNHDDCSYSRNTLCHMLHKPELQNFNLVFLSYLIVGNVLS